MKGSKLIASSLAGVAHALSLRSDLPSSTDGHLHDTRAEDLSVVPWQQSEPDLARRDAQSGAACGPTAGNVSCAAGLCCSDGNICGTGTAFCGAPACQLSYGPACDGNQAPTGKDTSSVPRPLFGNVPYGVDISHCSVLGKVALTFDDGPYIYTSDLLNLLKSNNVTATFFVVGANGGKGQIQDPATGYPAIIQRMRTDGHQIGSHTWSHQDLSALTAQQRHDQIIRNEIALTDILGYFPTYLRPPYTRWNADVLNDLKTLGYHVTNYDIDTRDWQGDYTYAQNTYTSILSQHSPATSSWVSLAHDIEDKTVHGFAQYMIDQAKKLGYQLVTVGECLGDPPSNWYRDPGSGQPVLPPKQVAQQQVSSSASSRTSGTSISSPLSTSTSTPTTTAAASVSSTTSALPSYSSSSAVPPPPPPPRSTSSVSSPALASTSSSSLPGTSSPKTITPSAIATPNFGAGTANTTRNSVPVPTAAATTKPKATPLPVASATPSSAGLARPSSLFGMLAVLLYILALL